MRPSLASALVCLLFAPLAAQTPTIRVLGVGKVAFQVTTDTVEDAQAQTYRAYVDTRPAVTVTATCAGTAAPFTCTFPLSELQLTGTHTFALTSVVGVEDG